MLRIDFRKAAMLVKVVVSAMALIAAVTTSVAGVAQEITFERIKLDDKFRSEGVAVGDFNGDGKNDIGAGSVFYAAPDWKMHPVLAAPQEADPHGYINSFVNFADDLNDDGRTDLIVVGFPGEATRWYQQPESPSAGPWKEHLITPVSNNESPQYLELLGKGQRQLLMAVSPDPAQPDGPQRYMAYLKPAADPYARWSIHRISADAAPGTTKYSHGVGAGDINGDGRNDVLCPKGWWEAPAGEATEWTWHDAPFGEDCAHMYVYDFDGDGDADVLSTAAHQLGMWWHEQTPDGWKTHTISTEFSQTHSLELADINGDGLPDFVTGKRYWAHGPNLDVDPGAPAMLYWFELKREDGTAKWIPHKVDDDSGVGTQFQVADVDGDGLLDIATANKKGAHLFLQRRK